jgi:hypothetical protein
LHLKLDSSRSYHEEKKNREGIRVMKRKKMEKEKGWKNNLRKPKKKKVRIRKSH